MTTTKYIMEVGLMSVVLLMKVTSVGLRIWTQDSTGVSWGRVCSAKVCLAVVFATSQELHRIIEWFGLEGTFKGHLVQSPCSEQGHLQLDQAAQSPIQPDLICFQGGGIHCFSGQPVPVFHHPNSVEFLPCIPSESTLFLFKAITPCPITTDPAKKFVPIFQFFSASWKSWNIQALQNLKWDWKFLSVFRSISAVGFKPSYS